MVRVGRIELPTHAPKARVIPLYYTHIKGCYAEYLQLSKFSHLDHSILERIPRIELG